MTLGSAFPLSGHLEHPTLGLVSYQLTPTSDDPDQQVADTISLMREYARADASHPYLLRDVAAAARSGDAIGDTFNYLRRDGVRGMRFVRDETLGAPFERSDAPGGWRPVVESLMRPADQAVCTVPQGDCDDFAMYGAAHLAARGVPVAYGTVAADSDTPAQYTHVYLVAYPSSGPYAGMRVPVDLSHGPRVGWEAPNQFGKFAEWPVNRGPSLVGLGLVAGGAYLLYRALKGRSN